MFQKAYWEDKLGEAATIYFDEGIGGYSTFRRPGFMKMLRDAMADKIDIIHTKSISRFCRNLNDLAEILQKFTDKGIAVLFEKEGINSLDTQASLLLKLQGIVAEQELKNNKQLVEQSRKRQFEKGRPYICVMPYGYKQSEYPNFVVDEEAAEKVRQIFKLFAGGWTIVEIIKHFRLHGITNRQGKTMWEAATIRNMLINEKYAGDVLMQKTYTDENYVSRKNNGEVKQYFIENNHEAIVDRETWIAVQRQILLRKPQGERKPHCKPESFRWGLTGRIVCADCGKKYKHKTRWITKTQTEKYWICRTKFQFGADFCCSKNLNASKLEQVAFSAYQEYSGEAVDYIGKLEQRLKELTSEQNDLTSMVLKHYINKAAYQVEIARIMAEFRQVDEALREVCQKKKNIPVGQYEKYDHAIGEHIDKIEVGKEGELSLFFINGKIIKRRIDNADSSKAVS